jgi:hypothetical protein
MNKSRAFTVMFAIALASPATSFADSLYGSCARRDGSKCNGAERVSTSWNSVKAYPKAGRYTLQFSGKVGKRITVYCNGNSVGSAMVSGQTRLDIVCH